MTSFDLERFWAAETDEHLDVAARTFAAMADMFGQWLDVCEDAVRRGNKIMFFGNGGSAADAQHIASELAVKLSSDRVPLPGLCLTLDPSALTAAANDYGFEHVFERQVMALGKPGDVAVGISTSGNSPNVLNALGAARKMDIRTVGLSGRNGGKMGDLCDILLVVPSANTARIQEMHIVLGHTLCGALERRLDLV